MGRVTLDRLADADLAGIAQYIGEVDHSPAAARRFIDNPNEKLQLYAAQPEMGELRPELGQHICVFSYGNYVVIYRPLDDGIDVLRVFEGHRDYPALFRRSS
jgi:toxin ParE1/3/4